MPDVKDSQETENFDGQYPLDPDSYNILGEIGVGPTAVVYKATCVSKNSEVVAIKVIDLDKTSIDLDEIRRGIRIMSRLSHPNVLRPHCSFVVDRSVWVVMPFMAAGSLLSVVMSSFTNGLPETIIAGVLIEMLKGLKYLYDEGYAHGGVKSGNILIDTNGSVKLTDFGLSASVHEIRDSNPVKLTDFGLSASVHEIRDSNRPGPSSSTSSPSVVDDMPETPYWIPPEVVHKTGGENGFEADMWSFGVMALELAYGHPPVSKLPPSKSLLMNIQKRFGFFDFEKKSSGAVKYFSHAFTNMVEYVLKKDPVSRPTAENLLQHQFFVEYRMRTDFLVRRMVDGLPMLEQRSNAKRNISTIGNSNEDQGGEEENEEEIDIKNSKIEWKFNSNTTKLDPIIIPIMTGGHELVRTVRFGGEIIIREPSTDSQARTEEGGTSTSLEAELGDAAGVGEIVEVGNGQNVGESEADGSLQGTFPVIPSTTNPVAPRGTNPVASPPPTILPAGQISTDIVLMFLVSLKRSLEEQRQKVIELITILGGEVSREDEVAERFRMELNQEKERSYQLELELDILRAQLMGSSANT